MKKNITLITFLLCSVIGWAQIPTGYYSTATGSGYTLKTQLFNIINNSNNGFQEGGAIAEIDLRVFNRYGQMVFRTTNPHEGWDGTFKGKPLNPATYTYILNFRTIDGRSDDRSGNVTLFR